MRHQITSETAARSVEEAMPRHARAQGETFSSIVDALGAERKRYGTVFADPPWPEKGAGKYKRGADRHYPVMPVREIVAMRDRVNAIVKPDAHLYLWTTNNYLPDALTVMDAWGFSYKTVLTWVKHGHAGLGQYYRGLTEHILFGVRGRPGYRLRRDGKRAQGVTGFFVARRGRHSEKPHLPYAWAKQVSPGPYLEMFGLDDRPGWRVLGNGLWTK